VGEHAALGPAGGARGVDDRGQVVRPHRGAPLLGLGVADPAPAAASSSSRSNVQIRSGAEAEALTSARCASVSTSAATAPESARIQSTCSALEVSYTGTQTAPADQIA
jgi:hypothetical protein